MATPATAARPGGAVQWSLSSLRTRRPAPGPSLLAALLVAILWAAFAHGATGVQDESKLQIGLAAIAVAACAAALYGAGLRVAAPALTWAGVGLMAGWAAWNGISLDWSVAPDRTWVEVNRVVSYTLVAGLAVIAAASYPRAREHLAVGYLVVAMLVALYALGGKWIPWFNIPHIVDFNQTGDFSRLRAPLEYWNALGIFSVMAIPIAMRYATDETRAEGQRVVALSCLPVLALAVGLTYSRGAVVSAVIGVTIGLIFSRARLRSMLMLVLGLAAMVPGLTYAYMADDLTSNGVSVSARTGEGLALLLITAAALVALVIVGSMVIRKEHATPADPARSRRVGLSLVTLLAAAVIAGAGVMAVSERGLTGTISDQIDDFTEPRAEDQFDPSRLLKTDNGNRWAWWKEAAGAWSDHPVKGSGAGSFPVLHRQYREDQLEVLQPHSTPLQLLAETGVIGFALATGGIGLLLLMALMYVGGLKPGRDRELGAVLLAAVIAYLVHGLYDWDIDIPGVTIPAIAFLGALAAGAPRRAGAEPPVSGRAALVVIAAVAGCTVALSAGLPAWSDSKATAAIRDLPADAAEAELVAAEEEADLASRLNPLDIQGLLNAAIIAERRGNLGDARDYQLKALRRQPSARIAWLELARLEARLGDIPAIKLAAERALELDPKSAGGRILLESAVAQLTPSNQSSTAIGTPLPGLVGEGEDADEEIEAPSEFLPWAYAAAGAADVDPAGSSFVTGPTRGATGATGPTGATGAE